VSRRDKQHPKQRGSIRRGTIALTLALTCHIIAASLILLAVPRLGERLLDSIEPIPVVLIPVVEPPPRPIERPREPSPSPLEPPTPLLRRAVASHRPTIEATPSSSVTEEVEPPEPDQERRSDEAQEAVPDLSPRAAAAGHLLGDDATRSEDEQAGDRLSEHLKSKLPRRPNDEPTPVDLQSDDEGNLIWDDEDFAGRLRRATVDKLKRHDMQETEEPLPHDLGYKERRPLKAKIAPDGTVEFERVWGMDITDEQVQITDIEGDCFHWVCEEARAVPTIGVPMRMLQDFNDLALMAAGDDPQAALKRRFLRDTEPLRDELAQKERSSHLLSSGSKLSERLDEIWLDATLGPSDKRRLIFELWDECEELAEGDEGTLEDRFGRQARNGILAFVRRRMPRGSPTAYDEAELQRLNAARDSSERFEPY
jgi:hypothetical protein